MNAKRFGRVIYALRKKNGYTQAELTERLSVSDKAVSRWESGVGYPDITLLPALASVLGVTIDALLREDKRGIVIAGNLIVDNVNKVDTYPAKGRLCNVISAEKAVGGCVSNTAIDLAMMDKKLPVAALGCVGDDDNGKFLVSALTVRGIDVTGISLCHGVATAYCDVMNDGGERTFFSYRGASAVFSPEDIDLNTLNCTVLYIGYINLLDKFDEADEEYGTAMARFLCNVKSKGIKTSIDTVSCENAEAYAERILSVLAHVDYLIINEIECCACFGESAYDKNGNLDKKAIKRCMEKMIEAGVIEKVVVHAPAGGFCLDAGGKFTAVGSLIIPQELIKGNVGAGDAFCAGCLYSIYTGRNDDEMLAFASASAACNLFSVSSVGGARSEKEILEISKRFLRREI